MNRDHAALTLFTVLFDRTGGNRICKFSFLGLSPSTSACHLEPRAQRNDILTLTCQACHNRSLAAGAVIRTPFKEILGSPFGLRNLQGATGLSPTHRHPASRSRDIDMS